MAAAELSLTRKFRFDVHQNTSNLGHFQLNVSLYRMSNFVGVGHRHGAIDQNVHFNQKIKADLSYQALMRA